MLNRRSFSAVLAAFTLGVAASCGAGDDAVDESAVAETSTTDKTTIVESDGTESSSGDSSEVSEPTEPESVEWNGPNFADVAEARMAELEAPIGMPYSPDAVAPVFAMPTDFPVMEGTITGVFDAWDVDAQDGDISEERIVGTDTVADDQDLKDHAVDFIGNDDAPWGMSSISDGGNNYGALFTSQNDAHADERLILRAFQDPAPGDPNFHWILELDPTEITAPAWADSLPFPDGGELGSYREGVGVVEDFGTPAQNGYLDITRTYPMEALPEIEAFFATDILTQAGFSFEDTPFNNSKIRVNLSSGDWSGQVSVWEGSYADTTYLGMTWALSRPVG